MKPLLDTHVLLWWLEESDRLPREHREVLDAANADRPLYLSDISLWEVATLHERGRIRLGLPLREWLERAAAPPLVRRVGISPAIAAEVAQLPSSFPRDPADRILAATSRILGGTLLTCDDRIIASQAVPTLPRRAPKRRRGRRPGLRG